MVHMSMIVVKWPEQEFPDFFGPVWLSWPKILMARHPCPRCSGTRGDLRSYFSARTGDPRPARENRAELDYTTNYWLLLLLRPPCPPIAPPFRSLTSAC